MAEVSSNIPQYSIPIVNAAGQVNDIWWRFFVTLFDRTGGGEGGDITQILIDLQRQQNEINDVSQAVDGNLATALLATFAGKLIELQTQMEMLQPVAPPRASGLNPDVSMTAGYGRSPAPAQMLTGYEPGITDPKGLRRTSADAMFGVTPVHQLENDQLLHAVATQALNGFMSATDKAKLDGINTSLISAAITADVTSNNTTADVPILSITIPAGALAVGSTFGASLYALVSSAALTGTINIWVKINATKAFTLALTTPAVGSTAQGISFYPRITCRAIGASGSLQMSGLFTSNNNVYNGGPVVNSALGSIDTTVSNTLTLGVNWSVANAGNTLAVKNCDITQVK